MRPFSSLSRLLRSRRLRHADPVPRRNLEPRPTRPVLPLRLEALEDRILLDGGFASATSSQVFDLGGSSDNGTLFLRQPVATTLIQGRINDTGDWKTLFDLRTLAAGATVRIDTALIGATFSLAGGKEPGDFVLSTDLFTYGHGLTLSARGSISVQDNLTVNTTTTGPIGSSGPAGDLTLEAINPPGAMFSTATPRILLGKKSVLKGADVTLKVEARQLSLNVPILTNLGLGTQTSTITVGEGAAIVGDNVTLTTFAGDTNPLDAVNKALADHPQVGGLIKSVLGYATDFLSLPISVQVKTPSAGVELQANSQILSSGDTTLSAEAVGDATGQAIYGFDTSLGVGIAFAINYAAPTATTTLGNGVKVTAGGSVLVSASTTSIAAGTARVTQNLGAGYLEGLSQTISPYSSRGYLSTDAGKKDNNAPGKALLEANGERVQISAVAAVSRPTSHVTISKDAEITARRNVAVEALGKSTNTQLVETASYYDGMAGVTVAIGVTEGNITADVQGKITVTAPSLSASPRTINPFLTVNFAQGSISFDSDHGLQTGDALTYTTNGGAIPGLEKDGTYYVIVVGPRTIQLAASRNQAKAGQAITIRPYPTLQKGTFALPITRVNEANNTLPYEFATGLAAGDAVTYHAVPGAAIRGLVDGAAYTVLAGGDPDNPNALRLMDSSGNVVRFNVSPRFTWGGKPVDFNVGQAPNTIDLRKKAFTPSVSGNTINLGYDHGFATGTKLIYFNGGAASTNIGGLTSGSIYYAVVDPTQPTKLRLAFNPEGTSIVPISSAGSGGAHSFYAAVATGDALTYSAALGLTIQGLTDGATYYAIASPYDPGLIRLTTSAADAQRAASAGQATYNDARQTVYDTAYQLSYNDWLYDHPGDTATATQRAAADGNKAVDDLRAQRPELEKVWYAAGLASARRADNSVIVLGLGTDTEVLSGTAHTFTPQARGVSVLARLVTSDTAVTRAGVGGEPTLRDTFTKGEVGGSALLDGLINKLKGTSTAKNAVKADVEANGTNAPSFTAAASLAVHVATNKVHANVGSVDAAGVPTSSPVLKSAGDIAIRSEITQKSQRSVEATLTKPPSSATPTAVALALSFGIYTNEAKTSLFDGAQLDASGRLAITSSVVYPFLFPTTAPDAESVFTGNLVAGAGALVNGRLGLDRFLFNAWTHTAATAPDASTAVAGSLSVPVLTNQSIVSIGKVKINQDAAYRSTRQSLDVEADTDLVIVDMTGNFVLELSPEGLSNLVRSGRSPFNFGTQAGDNGVGLSFYVLVANNTTSATVAPGATIYVSDTAQGMSLKAETTVVNVSLAATTGMAKSTGFAGTLAISDVKNRTTAQVASGAVIQGTTLDIDAHDSTVQVNLAGSFGLSSRKGFGFTVTTNVLDRETLALIGANPKKSETPGISSLSMSGNLVVTARNTGALVAISVAAAVVAPDPVPASSDPTAGKTAQDAGSLANLKSKLAGSSVGTQAAGQVDGGYGVGISGDLGLNFVTDDTAYALINDKQPDDANAWNIRAAAVTVTATNSTGIGAIAGAVAMSVAANADGNVAIAGSFSGNRITGDTQAYVTGVQLQANSLTVGANRTGVIAVLTAAGAGAPGGDGNAVGLSVSVNVLADTVKAYLSNSRVILAGDLKVKSTNESLIIAVGGGVGYGGKVGVGAAIGVNVVTNKTYAYLDGADVSQTAGGLSVTASNDNPGSDARIVALTGTVGASVTGSGGAGMVSVNVIAQDTQAYATNSDYVSTNTNPLTNAVSIHATDNSWIISLGFAVGVGADKGVGAALSVNVISDTVKAYLQDTVDFVAPGQLSIRATTGGTIGSATVGVAGSGSGTGFAGSLSVNVISNTTQAYIGTTTIHAAVVSAAGNIEVKAADTSLIVGIAGGVGISLAGNAVGGALNVNAIANTTSASIAGAKVTATGADSTLTVQADESALIVGITVGVAGSGGDLAVSGSVSLNVINNHTTASIGTAPAGVEKAATVQAGGTVKVAASDNSRLVLIAGAVSVSFSGTAVGLSVSINTITNETRASIDGSRATSVNGAVLVSAGWDAPQAALPTSLTLSTGNPGDTPMTVTLPTLDNSPDLLKGQVVAVSVAGSAAADTAAAGALPVNVISNTFTGRIRSSTVTAGGNVEVKVNDSSSIDTGALGLALSAGSGGGATIGSSDIANTLNAFIENSTVTAGQQVVTQAQEVAQIITIALGLGAAGNFALGGSVGVNVIKNEVEAHVSTNSNVTAALVNVSASDTSSIFAGLGGAALSLSGTAVGAAVGSNTVANHVIARIDRSNVTATSGDVQVLATSKPQIGSGAVGGALGVGSTAVSGSILFTTSSNRTEAFITDDGTHRVTADGNVAVSALQDVKLDVGTGAFSISFGAGAFGVANSTLITIDEVDAYVGAFATVDARGNRGAYAAYTGKKSPDGDLLTENVYGVSVTATSYQDILSLAVAGSGAAGATLAGSGTVEVLNETSTAHIDRGARVNLDTQNVNALQSVNVHATNYTRAIMGAGAVAGGLGTGVGAGIDVGTLVKSTEAYIADASVSSRSFAASAVDTDKETIDFKQNHGWTTGQALVYNNGGGAGIGGLASGDTVYYAIVLNPTTIKLATSRANAIARIAVDLTSAGTSSSQSFKAVTDQAAQTFGPSAVTIGDDANTIDLGIPHGFTTGQAVVYNASGGTPIGGLQPGRVYYAIVDSTKLTRLRLAASLDAANQGVAIPLTSTGTVSAQTITRADLGTPVSLSGAAVRLATDGNTLTTATPHGLTTGSRVLYGSSDVGDVGGLLNRQTYYAIVLSPTKLRLAATPEDAAAGRAITLTKPSGAVQAIRRVFPSSAFFNGANVADQTIDLGYKHGFRTGDLVAYDNGGGTSIGSLQQAQTYYAVEVPNQPTKLRLAADAQSARDGKVLALTPGDGTRQAFYAVDAGLEKFNASVGVDTANDTIDLGEKADFSAGDPVVYQRLGSSAIGNLVDGRVYFVVLVSNEPTRIRLAETRGQALDGTYKDLTSVPTSTQQTLTPYSYGPSTRPFGPADVDYYSPLQNSLAIDYGSNPDIRYAVYDPGSGEGIAGLDAGRAYYLVHDVPVAGRTSLAETDPQGTNPPTRYVPLFSTGTGNDQSFRSIVAGSTINFDPANIVTGAEKNSIFFSSSHGFHTGDVVLYDNGGGPTIGGLQSGQTYFAVVDTANPKMLRLAASLDDLAQGKAIDLTSAGGGSFRLVTLGLPLPFTSAAVVLGTKSVNRITLAREHGLAKGQAVVYDNGAGDSIGGLKQGGIYYVIPDPSDPKSFRLASSKALADAGTAITLTSRGTSLLQTFRPVDVPADAPLNAPVTVRSRGNVRVRAESTENVLSLSFAGAFSNNASIAGTLGIWALIPTTQASIGTFADVQAGGSVQVSARDVDNLNLLIGSASIAGGGSIGAALAIPVVVKNTSAFISPNAQVEGLGGGAALAADTGEFDVTYGDPVFNPATAVDPDTDWITLSYEHGFSTGQEVVYDSGDGTTLGGLTSGKTYFAIIDPDNPKRLRLAATKDDAKAGKQIDVTSRGTGTKHSIKQVGTLSPSINNPAVTAPGLVSRRLVSNRTIPVQGVIVTATSTDDVEQMAIAASGAGYVAIPISAAVHVLDSTTQAYVGKQARVNSNQASANAAQSVHVAAGSDYYHLGVSGGIGGAGIAVAGGALDVAVPTVRSKAYIDQGATVNAANNVGVQAHTEAQVLIVTVGVSVAGFAGLTGSISVLAVNTETKAWIGRDVGDDSKTEPLSAVARAGNNVLLLATDNTSSLAVDGAVGIGITGGGAGISLPIVVFTKDTAAYVGRNAKVEGKALGTDVMTITDDVAPPVPQYFDGSSSSAVNATTDTITLGYDHGFMTGQEVFYDSGADVNVGGLLTGVTYYAIVTGPRTLKLARTRDDALKGTAIDLTGLGTGKKHTLRPGSDFRTTTAKGVALQARSSEDSLTVGLAGGGGLFGGIAGVVAVTVINSNTRAFIEGAEINVPVAGSRQAGSAQSVSVAATNATRVKTVAPTVAGGLGAAAGAINVTYVNNKTQAYVGDKSTVNASKDVGVSALSYKDYDIFSLSLAGGAAALGASVSVVTLGAAITDEGHKALTDKNDSRNTVSKTVSDQGKSDRVSDLLNKNTTDPNSSTTVSTNGDKQTSGNSGLVTSGTSGSASLVKGTQTNTQASTALDSTTPPASGTAAFIGMDATVTAGGDVDVHATETVRVIASSGGISGGLAGIGAAVGVVTINSLTNAYIDSGTVVSAGGDVDVSANYNGLSSLLAYTGTGGLAAALGAQVASATDNSVQKAFINDNAEVRRAQAIAIEASANRTVTSELGGVSVGGVAIGASYGTATAAGSTRAYVGDKVKVGQRAGESVSSLSVSASNTSSAESRGFLVTAGLGAFAISNFNATINPTVEGSIGSNSQVTVSGSVDVAATSSATANVDNRGGASGAVAVSAMLSFAEIGGSTTALIGDGTRVTAHDLSVMASAPVRKATSTTQLISVTILSGSGGSTTKATVGGDLGGSVAAYVGPADGTTPGTTPAQLNVSGSVTVEADSTANPDANATVGAGGLLNGDAGAVVTAKVDSGTRAYLGANTVVGTDVDKAGSLTVTATATDVATSSATVGSAGVYAPRGAKAEADLYPNVAAFLGKGASARLQGDLTMTAKSVRAEGHATANSAGGGAIDVGAPNAIVNSTPQVSAYLAANTDVTAGGNVTVEAFGLSDPASTTGPLTDNIKSVDATADTITFPVHGLQRGDFVLYDKGDATTGIQVPTDTGSRDLPITVAGPNNTTTKRLYRVLTVDENTLRLGVQADMKAQSIDSGDLFGQDEGVDSARNVLQFTSPHRLETGDPIRYFRGANTDSIGLSANTTYYVRKIDDFTVKFYATRAAAEAAGRTFTVDATNKTVQMTGHGFNTGDRVTYLAPPPSEFRSAFVNADPQFDANKNLTGFVPQTNPDYTIYLPNHGFKSQDAVTYRTNGTPITNLVNNTIYYVIRIDANRFQLAKTAAEAVSQPGPNNTTLPPVPIHIGTAAGSENARHFLVPKPVAGLVSGGSYTVEKVDADKFKLKDSAGTVIAVDATGTAGTHLIGRDGVALSPAAGTHQIAIDISAASAPAGKDKLLGSSGVSLRLVSPPAGTGQSTASASGRSGGGLSFSTPTANLTVSPKVKAFVAGKQLTASGNVTVASNTVGNLSATSDDKGGGVIASREANATTTFGSANDKAKSLAFIGTEDATGNVTASGVKVTAGGLFTLSATSSLTSFIDSSAQGGGLGASLRANGTANTDLNTTATVGDGAQVTAPNVSLLAKVLSLKPTVNTTAIGGGLGGEARATSNFGINSTADVLIGGGSTRIKGTAGVVILARHDSYDRASDPDAQFYGIGPSDPKTNDNNHLKAHVTAEAGATVEAGPGAGTYALAVRAERADSVNLGSHTSSEATVVWDANVTVSRSLNPELVIDKDSKITQISNLTVLDGTKTLTRVGDQVKGGSIVVNDVVDGAASQVLFRGSSGVRNSARSPRPLFTMVNTYSEVRIVNNSDTTLQIGNVTTVSSSSALTPTVVLDSSNKDDDFQFDIANAAGPTNVIITQSPKSLAKDLILAGVIDNPIGTTTITSTRGMILRQGSGLVRTNALTLSSAAGIGTSDSRLSAELVQVKDASGTVLAPSLSVDGGSQGSVYLQLRGRQRDGTGSALTVHADSLKAKDDIDVLLLPMVTDTLLDGRTAGKLHVEVTANANLTDDYSTRFTSDDGIATPLNPGVYGTTTNTNPIAGTYSFLNRAVSGSPGLIAGGKVKLVASSANVGSPIINLVGVLSGGIDELDVTTTGSIDLRDVSGGPMQVGTVQSVSSSVRLTVPDLATDLQDLVLLAGGKIQAATTVTLAVGDNLRTQAGSLISAGTNIAVAIDYLSVDDGGATVTIDGALSSPVTDIVGGPNNDAFQLAYANGINAGLASAVVRVDGFGGTDSLLVSDASDTGASSGSMTATMVAGLGMGGDGVAYKGISSVEVRLSQGGSSFNVHGTGVRTRVLGGTGNDVITVASQDTQPRDLSQVLGELTVDAAGGSANRLILDDSGAAAGNSVTITKARITGLAPVAINYSAAGGSFSNGSTNDGILIRGSNLLADTFNVQSTLADSTTKIDGLGGDDTFNVFSDASANLGNLDGITGTLTVEGGSGSNRLVVSDAGGAGNADVVVTDSAITGLAPVAIFYVATGGSFANGATNDGILIRGSGTAADTFNVRSTRSGSTTKIDGLGGDDVFNVSSDAGTNLGNLDAVLGTLTIEAGPGNNRLVVSDGGATTGNANVIVTDSVITGLAPAAIFYGATGGNFTNGAANSGVLLRGSDREADTFNVQSTLSGSTTRIEGNGGNDVFNVSSDAGASSGNLDAIVGTLTVEGGSGSNRLVVSDAGAAAGNANVIVTDRAITNLAPATIFYSAVGGSFSNGPTNDGILLRGSDRAADTFNVQSTLAASTTKIDGLGGDDAFNVSSDAGTNLGNLNGVLGTLTVEAGSGFNRLTLSDYSATAGNVSVTVTSSSITGLAPVPVFYAATGGSFSDGAANDGILIRGSNTAADTFNVQSTLAGSTTKIAALGGDDTFNVSSDAGTNLGNLDAILGTLTLDGGTGNANRLIVSDFGSAVANPSVTVTDRAITGFAPADILYYAPGGSFTNGNTGDGILLRGSNQAADTFLIVSTLRGSTIKVEGNGGADAFNVGSTFAANFGNLNTIQGRLRIDGGTDAAGSRDSVYVNDRGFTNAAGQPVRANYTLSPTSLVPFAINASMHLEDPTLNAPPRTDFAGIDYDGSTEYFRLDGTDAVNVFDVKPSLQTEYYVNGNLPASGAPLFGGGDYLMLDTSATAGRRLGIQSLGAGNWTFSSAHKPVGFENVERFNHVAIVASTVDAGTGSVPNVVVRDAETGEFRFQVLAYESLFRGGVQTAVGDLNGDGLPDLIVAPGAGRDPTVKIYNGSPNVAGVYPGTLLTAFPAYSPTYVGGVNVAVGDVNHDGMDDLVTVTRGVTLPEVRIFDGRFLQTTRQLVGTPFLADSTTFRGVTSLAVGDLNRDGYADIITQRGSPGATGVRIFDGRTFTLLKEFAAFGQTFPDGGSIAIGDYNGDGQRDLIVGAGAGWLPQVKVYDGASLFQTVAGQTLTERLVAVSTFRNGVRVKVAPVGGGNPGFIEGVYVMAELPGTQEVVTFSLVTGGTSTGVGTTVSPIVLRTNGELDLLNTQTNVFQVLSPAGTIAFATPLLDGAGNELVFAITQTPGYVGTLWEYNVTTGAWAELSSGYFLQISATTNAAGKAVLFGLVADHSLWVQNPVNTTLNAGWTLLSPANTIDSISAITDSAGNPYVYAITAATSGRQVWQYSPALAAGWKMVSATATGSISVGLNSAGQAEVFAVGLDNSLWQINPALNGGAPVLLSPAGTVLSVTAGRGPDSVFAITAPGHNLWQYSNATGWRLLSTLSFAQLSATQNQSAMDVLFATLSDGSFGEFFNNAFSWLASGVAYSLTPR